MEDRIVTLAIHSKEKADQLKLVLEERGIPVFLEELIPGDSSKRKMTGFAVKVNALHVAKAMTIIEELKLFSYSDKQTLDMDDGRKRILVAVDFSSYSMKVCQIAFSIAKEIDAKVKILHVYNNIYFPSHIPFADILKEDTDVGILDKSRKKMLNLCFEIDKNITEGKFPSVNYSYSLREGIIEEEIDSFINEYKPALLVLGTRGKNNNQKNILGSIAADLIEMTDVPVLAIPENSSITDVRKVKHLAFFVSINKRDLLSFDYLVNHLTAHKGLKISLIHVAADPRNSIRLTEAELSGFNEFLNKKYEGLNVTYKLIDSLNPIPDIKKFLEEEEVKIVAVNTRRRNIWGRIFIPSTSRKMLASLDAALLALRGSPNPL